MVRHGVAALLPCPAGRAVRRPAGAAPAAPGDHHHVGQQRPGQPWRLGSSSARSRRRARSPLQVARPTPSYARSSASTTSGPRSRRWTTSVDRGPGDALPRGTPAAGPLHAMGAEGRQASLDVAVEVEHFQADTTRWSPGSRSCSSARSRIGCRRGRASSANSASPTTWHCGLRGCSTPSRCWTSPRSRPRTSGRPRRSRLSLLRDLRAHGGRPHADAHHGVAAQRPVDRAGPFGVALDLYAALAGLHDQRADLDLVQRARPPNASPPGRTPTARV